jgi:hypothetical protein
MEILIYLAIAAALVGVAIGGIWLRRRFNIKNADLELAQLILQVIDLLVAKGNIKYKGEISIVVNYVIEAITFVNKFDEVDSIHQQKEFISEKALKIAEENGIKPDQALVELIDQIVDYFIKSEAK